MKLYKTAQAAIKLGISKQTLLRYEKKGILPRPSRNHINSWREYTDEDIRKMRHILGRGFTVMEVVIVVLIVGIIAALAVPRFTSFYSIKLNGAMKKIVSDIRYVQQIGLSRHTNTRIVFSPTAETYTAEEEVPAGSGTWQKIKNPVTFTNLTADYTKDAQYRGINIASANFNGTSTLQFSWQGVPVSGGNAVFTYQGEQRSVTVENNTAALSVQ